MKTFKVISACVLFSVLGACDSITGLKNFAECKFKFQSVSDVKLGSIDLSKKKSYKSLKFSEVSELMSGYVNKELMLDLTVNMKVNNPNEQVAQLDGMDYILWIDDQQMVEGVTTNQVRIEPKSEENVSLPVTLNVYDAVRDKKLETMAQFALGLATDNADASRVKVSIKPFFTFGRDTVRFPSFITIGGDQIMPKKKN